MNFLEYEEFTLYENIHLGSNVNTNSLHSWCGYIHGNVVHEI